MEIFGNVEIYNDDEEIIEILYKLPKIEECENMNVLEFMQEKTIKSDFGTVILFKEFVYTIYKFDIHLIKEEDAGLLLTKSKRKYVLEQLQIWRTFRETGMSFSDKIFDVFENTLTGSHFIENYFYKNSNI